MSTIERHLTDDELLRLLDGEPVTGESPGPDHAERCGRCADALEALRAESDLVRGWLERAAFEAPGPGALGLDARVLVAPDATAVRALRPRPRRAPGSGALLKAAAVILLVAGPLAAFPGVRAWVAERIAPSAEVPEAPVADAVVLRFVPSPGGFAVNFPAGTSGVLSLKRSDGGEAELRVEGGTPETVVTAASLEIRNDQAGRYELRLPGTVAGVWVRVGERAVAVTAVQIERGTVIDLGR